MCKLLTNDQNLRIVRFQAEHVGIRSGKSLNCWKQRRAERHTHQWGTGYYSRWWVEQIEYKYENILLSHVLGSDLILLLEVLSGPHIWEDLLLTSKSCITQQSHSLPVNVSGRALYVILSTWSEVLAGGSRTSRQSITRSTYFRSPMTWKRYEPLNYCQCWILLFQSRHTYENIVSCRISLS